MNLYCYECVASFVRAGGRPLATIHGANNWNHTPANCSSCNTPEMLVPYPDSDVPAEVPAIIAARGQLVSRGNTGQTALVLLAQEQEKGELSDSTLIGFFSDVVCLSREHADMKATIQGIIRALEGKE